MSFWDPNLEQQAYGSLNNAIDAYSSSGVGNQIGGVISNAPGKIFDAATRGVGQAIGAAVDGAIFGINDSINNAINSGINSILYGGSGNGAGGDEPGVWESVKYASDLIPNAPKYKFMFKVLFGFAVGGCVRDFYCFVRSIDKPKITFVYEDVNFYNFRSKVLTKTQHEPLTITFFDDIGNSVFTFFQTYRNFVSPVANDHSVLGAEDRGMLFGPSCSASSKSDKPILTYIKLQQIYAHGTASNIYTFVNPRIENFDFDGVDHEDSQFNSVTVQFNYDNLFLESVGQGTLYNWGMTDILKGGGMAGLAGGSVGGYGTQLNPMSIDGYGIGNPKNRIGRVCSPYVNGTSINFGGIIKDAIGYGIGSTVNSAEQIINKTIDGTIRSLVTNGANSTKSNIDGLLNSISKGSVQEAPKDLGDTAYI